MSSSKFYMSSTRVPNATVQYCLSKVCGTYYGVYFSCYLLSFVWGKCYEEIMILFMQFN